MKLSLLLLPGWLLAAPALAQTAATFAPVATYSTGTNSQPSGLAVADVNSDGKPDVLAANSLSGEVRVLLGTSTGAFSLGAAYSTNQPMSVVAADVNSDGKLDLVTASVSAGALLVRLGGGTGTFGNFFIYTIGSGTNPVALAVADVNNDGRPDVLTANSGTNTAGVLLGTGQGNFGNAVFYSTGTGSQPQGIAVADVNGDGKLDMLTTNSGTNTVGVLLGTGTGSFGAVTTYGTGSSPHGMAVADANGDGKLDLFTANTNSDNVGVLLGTGIGSFGPVTTYATGVALGLPYGIAAADVNRDGKLDLLTTNSSSSGSSVSVLLGTGTGTFGTSTTYSTSATSQPTAIAVADVNGDLRPDIITANSNTSTIGVLLNTTLLPTRAALPGARATLAPNPARSSTTLTATGLPAAATQVVVVLLNPLGQEVRRLTVPATAGAAMGTVPTAGLAAGLYLLRLDALDVQGALLGGLPVQRLSVE